MCDTDSIPIQFCTSKLMWILLSLWINSRARELLPKQHTCWSNCFAFCMTASSLTSLRPLVPHWYLWSSIFRMFYVSIELAFSSMHVNFILHCELMQRWMERMVWPSWNQFKEFQLRKSFCILSCLNGWHHPEFLCVYLRWYLCFCADRMIVRDQTFPPQGHTALEWKLCVSKQQRHTWNNIAQ